MFNILIGALTGFCIMVVVMILVETSVYWSNIKITQSVLNGYIEKPTLSSIGWYRFNCARYYIIFGTYGNTNGACIFSEPGDRCLVSTWRGWGFGPAAYYQYKLVKRLKQIILLLGYDEVKI